MEYKIDDIMKELVHQKGIKLTSKRKSVLEIMIKNKHQHFTAKDIENIAGDMEMVISISTIYRTLELFEKWGIIMRHNFQDDSAIYEYAYKEDHHHLICKHCGQVIEITGLIPDDLNERLTEIGFEYVSYHLKIYGYCRACKDKDRSVV